MSGHRKFSELREQVLAEAGGAEAVAEARAEALEDVRVSTLRDYLDAMGARLELVAVFDEDGERRVPVHLGREPAA